VNIDERLEALTQSVELLAAMQRDGERRFQEQFDKVTGQFKLHEQLFGQVALRLREVTDNIREVNDSIDSLARIAGVHQERLDRHEQKLRDLEGPRT
jgi:hypothetical protein